MTDIRKRLIALANCIGGSEEDDIMAGVAEIERLRKLASAFLDCQTDENAEALRRALEPKP